MYLFLTPSKTDGRVPSQQGAPTTRNLTYWEVTRKRMSRHYWPVWVWSWGKIKPLVGGGGRGVGKEIGCERDPQTVVQLAMSTMCNIV